MSIGPKLEVQNPKSRTTNRILLILFLFWTLDVGLWTLDPLWAVTVSSMQVAPRRGVTIATIDLEKVFQAYPETKKARGELEKLILIKENEIAAKRAEIFILKEDIAVLKIKAALAVPVGPAIPEAKDTPPSVAASSETIAGSTDSLTADLLMMTTVAAAAAPPAAEAGPLNVSVVSLETINAEIADKEEGMRRKTAELKGLERSAERNLEDLERAKTKTLLAKIYFTLRELAQEKNVDMIVDKNAILWGSSWLDLTDELIRKLKTVMIERE
ncbi:MAG: OmpH family outer membrane protein [Elusimicrobia bacterium]|nr:OmpH family outer membrane protein [Elusimicrobiota bacterium]